MAIALVVFLLVVGAVVGAYVAATRIPTAMARHRLELRLRDVAQTAAAPDAGVIAPSAEGPLPSVDRLVARTTAGSRLARLIEQAGLRTTPGALLIVSAALALAAALTAQAVARTPYAVLAALPAGAALPTVWLVRRRAARLRLFEEQFPEALDLVSRAIRAGHAFQTAVGMAADELPAPVGPEFRKVFDQQNFGLPVRDALEALAGRVPIVDVKFFVTAVAIQRETGGNLAEILDNLSHVVRERFKIHRQVRVHTAHGRITGLVLLALPAFLAVALSFINPDHMRPLFEERIGQMLLVGTIVMQAVGFLWIRRVIRIEV